MVDIVKLRAATFIPLTWLDSPRRGEETIQFQGDDRGFTPHAVNTGRSRVEQEVVIDLSPGVSRIHEYWALKRAN